MLTALIIAAPLVILGLLMYAATVEEQRWVDTVEQPGIDDAVEDVGAPPWVVPERPTDAGGPELGRDTAPRDRTSRISSDR